MEVLTAGVSGNLSPGGRQNSAGPRGCCTRGRLPLLLLCCSSFRPTDPSPPLPLRPPFAQEALSALDAPKGRLHRRTDSCSHSRTRARPTPPATTWDPRRPLTSRGARCHLLGLWFRLLRPLPGPSSRRRARAPRAPRAHHDPSGSRHFRQRPGRVGLRAGSEGSEGAAGSPRAL